MSPLGAVVPPERRRIALSPINKRRWENFKSNRRGYWSFWLFLVLFFVSLFAEFIANDKPFMIRHEGEAVFPGRRDLFRNGRSAANSKPRRTIATAICRR